VPALVTTARTLRNSLRNGQLCEAMYTVVTAASFGVGWWHKYRTAPLAYTVGEDAHYKVAPGVWRIQ
jgi:hypothetical protein